MNRQNPTIRINVDPSNPGQFFACCGLLELADRLWRRAEGWFEQRQFCMSSVAALLTILPGSDWVLRQYVEESRTWSTVTPVILPGYDDPDHLRRKLKNGRDAETQKRYLARLDARMDELLRKAFRQAGYSSELIEQAELEWREVGFRPGVELASRYLPPENLNGAPRIHVRVRFPTAVRGPIAVGSGRFRGFGLFAKVEN